MPKIVKLYKRQNICFWPLSILNVIYSIVVRCFGVGILSLDVVSYFIYILTLISYDDDGVGGGGDTTEPIFISLFI